MNSPPQADQDVGSAKLTVRTMPADQSISDGGCLARFQFGQVDRFGPDEDLHGMTLEVIDGSSMIEEWRVDQPVEHGIHEGIAWSRSGELLLLSWTDAIDHQSVQSQSRDIYRQLLNTLSSLGHPYVVKAWNHLPDINQGSGDQERYKQFCLGRAEAMDEALPRQPMPAGTAVGSRPDRPLQILVLASANVPRAVENPRQMSAYHYPRQYGERSPSFSRAAMTRNNMLFVSGTAAITGHESQHIGQVERQIRETILNWRSVLQHAADGGETPGLEKVSGFRVYLRKDYCRDIAQRLLAHSKIRPDQLVFLEASICRQELLFELDGMVNLG